MFCKLFCTAKFPLLFDFLQSRIAKKNVIYMILHSLTSTFSYNTYSYSATNNKYLLTPYYLPCPN